MSHAGRSAASLIAGTHDVLVDGSAVVASLATVAATAGARFVEVALMLTRADAIVAFQRRSSQ